MTILNWSHTVKELREREREEEESIDIIKFNFRKKQVGILCILHRKKSKLIIFF